MIESKTVHSMELLLQYLHSIHPISEELDEHLRTILKMRQIDKRSFLLKAGHICRSIYFIEKGLVRCFYMKHDQEVNSWFMKEGDIIVSIESFFFQVESYESIQTIEDSIVYGIEHAQLEKIYKEFPEFNYIARILLQKYYQLSEQRLYSMRMQTAAERYHFLLNYFPEIVQRVSSTDIASYLGNSRETISRIKKYSLK